jgi:transcription initiation factor IIF auxiliary subunit
MTLKIAQDFEYQEKDWWKWRVWIDGPEEELDEIDYVVYRLHSTFPDPVRTIRDRKSKFELSTAGWGVFTIYANVKFKAGNDLKLYHDLDLKYPDGTSTTA